jgi:hypothetical protein
LELPPQGRKETESRAAHVDLDQHEVRFGSWLRGNSETEFANRKFVPTSINLKSESAGDGRGDKTIEKTILRTFRARTFSRSQGQKAKNSRRAHVFRFGSDNGHAVVAPP